MTIRRFSLTALLLLAACVGAPQKGPEPFHLRATTFAALPGWNNDAVAEALPAFQKSCDRIAKKSPADPFSFAGTHADWQSVCAKMPADASQARAYFEQNFTPYEIWGDDRDGLFTGYYEPTLTESADPNAAALYAVPQDLVTANLGDFKPELKGQSITGRVENGKFIPYYTRADIEKGAIRDKAAVLARVTDPVDAFFLQVQGSGVVKKADGTDLNVGYAGQNGQAYTAIGKELLKRGELQEGDVSMQSIRAWLAAHPAQAAEIMDANKSYVFFRDLGTAGAIGAEGVALTPTRSLAIDHKKIPYGAPIFLDAEGPGGDGRIQRLMVAQDTGGAITGSVRGDFFWGPGPAAAETAGIMKSHGQAYILLPRNIVVPENILK